jgi:hypothetical protein
MQLQLLVQFYQHCDSTGQVLARLNGRQTDISVVKPKHISRATTDLQWLLETMKLP